MTHEVIGMAYRILKRMFRNVAVSRDLLKRLIDSMDYDEDGRISLAEVAVALKVLWKKANGKLDKPKKVKVKTLD